MKYFATTLTLMLSNSYCRQLSKKCEYPSQYMVVLKTATCCYLYTDSDRDREFYMTFYEAESAMRLAMTSIYKCNTIRHIL